MKRKIALIIAIALSLPVGFLAGNLIAEAQTEPDTPGLTIGAETCAAAPVILRVALLDLAGGEIMFLDPTKTVLNPNAAESNIRFIDTNDVLISGHYQITLDVYPVTYKPGAIPAGTQGYKLVDICQLGDSDMEIKWHYFEEAGEDGGTRFLVKFP